MANTVTSQYVVYNGRESTLYITLASDGTQETARLIYDSSAAATELAKQGALYPDPLSCRILEIYGSVSAASTARVTLLYDATTDILAMDIPAGQSPTKANFRRFGGLLNAAGAGKTGDILLTTTGLAAGDAITLVITVGAY